MNTAVQFIFCVQTTRDPTLLVPGRVRWEPRKMTKSQPQGGMMKRLCFPLAATPSSLLTSESSNLARASRNPFKFASIREGVTDLGRTTHPFLSAREKDNLVDQSLTPY